MTPLPTTLERDAAGRLVYAAIDSPKLALSGTPRSCWLVAIDDSDYSLRATAETLRITGNLGHQGLHLIHVLPWLAKEAAEAELIQRGWDHTARARSLLDLSGQAWTLHIALGDPAEAIIARSKKLDGCCIVIGSRGLGPVSNVLFGSVSNQVLHLATTPVLVVK